MTSSSFATSVTVFAIGPSWPTGDGHPAHMPERVTRPGVGRMPTTLFQVDGRRMDAKPSSPIATAPKFALTPAPGPPEEPPTVRSGSYGLRVTPNSEPYVSP